MEKDRNQLFSFDKLIPEPSEPLIVAASANTGEQLAAARMRLNLSAQDVAEALKLTENIIIAIENREYDQLYGVAYATGYVRSYAKLVNLNPNELIKNDPELGIVEIENNQFNSAIPKPGGATFWNTRWIAIIVRALVVTSILAAVFAIWLNWEEVSQMWQSVTTEEVSTEEPAPVPQSESTPINEPPTDTQNATP